MMRAKVLSRLSLLVIVAAFCSTRRVDAEELSSAAAQFAEQSFALLDRLSKLGDTSPLLGPVASFSGDADNLRQALARNNLGAASSDIISLKADRGVIDQALKQHPNAIPAEEWAGLRQQIDQLARQIPACGAHSDCGPPAAIGGVPPAVPDRSESVSTGSVSRTSGSPRIVIASRDSNSGIVRLKGYFDGDALKSAGIYEGSRLLKDFKVNGVPGRQRVEFDLKLENPSPATVIRVTDSDDNVAEATAIDPGSPSPLLPSAAPYSSLASSAAFPDDREMRRRVGDDARIAEIPSHGPLTASPSKRHTLAGRLGDARIDIVGVTRTSNLPAAYEIVGQISGRGITRAGIYLDGRLVQPIPIADSANITGFDRRFVAESGSVTVRAYSVGDEFIEQPVNLNDAEGTGLLAEGDAQSMPAATGPTIALGMPMSMARLTIQLSAIRPLARNLCVVSGVISGAHIASAGLYQNGVLMQNIRIDNGLAGSLGALLLGSSSTVNFNVSFNPDAGPAVVRAFGSDGAYTEQPVIIAGISPAGPPWLASPYGLGNLPLGGGSPVTQYRNNLSTTRPLW